MPVKGGFLQHPPVDRQGSQRGSPDPLQDRPGLLPDLLTK